MKYWKLVTTALLCSQLLHLIFNEKLMLLNNNNNNNNVAIIIYFLLSHLGWKGIYATLREVREGVSFWITEPAPFSSIYSESPLIQEDWKGAWLPGRTIVICAGDYIDHIQLCVNRKQSHHYKYFNSCTSLCTLKLLVQSLEMTRSP